MKEVVKARMVSLKRKRRGRSIVVGKISTEYNNHSSVRLTLHGYRLHYLWSFVPL